MTTSNTLRTTGQRLHAGRLSVPQKTGSTRTVETVRDGDGQVTSRVRRTVLPGGLRVITEQMAGVRSASIGVWVGVGSRDETADPARLLPLPRAPAVQGHPRAFGDGHLGRPRRGGRRVQRLHRQGVHLLPRAGARRRPAARGRRARRHDDRLADRGVRRGGRARRHPRRDRDARRRPRRRRPQPVRRAGVGQRSARPPDRRHDGVDHDDQPRAGAAVLPTPLPPGQHGGRDRGQRRPRQGRAARTPRLRTQRLPVRRRSAAGAALGRPRPARARRHRHRPPPARAGQPRARRQRADPQRRPPLRARRAQHRTRRGHLLPAVPGGPRAARPGLLRVLLRQPPRRCRSGRRLRGLPAQQARRRVVDGPGRAREGGRRRHHRGGARARQGPAPGWAGARPRGLRLADVAAGQGRAGLRRAALARRGDPPGRGRHPRRRTRHRGRAVHAARDPGHRRSRPSAPSARLLRRRPPRARWRRCR